MSYPPRHGDNRHVKVPPQRFSVGPALSGFEVIDFDGRPVVCEPFQHDADAIASDLNKAAQAGGKTLAAALGSL